MGISGIATERLLSALSAFTPANPPALANRLYRIRKIVGLDALRPFIVDIVTNRKGILN